MYVLSGKSGHLLLDDQADREPDYWLWQLKPDGEVFEYYAEIKMTEPRGKVSSGTACTYTQETRLIPHAHIPRKFGSSVSDQKFSRLIEVLSSIRTTESN